MTYIDAIKQGYCLSDITYQKGYVSRRVNLYDQKVLIAGGRRQGQLYILAPCYHSTIYCLRYYLSK